MTFTGMDYFITVARERSFTKAAEKLHITQQSLSAHIATIEQELGCKLLVRKVPLELTYAGKVFLKYATDFTSSLNSLEHEMCDIAENHRGMLRIGVTFTRGRAIMPHIIESFQKIYPNITIELEEASNEALHKKLINGEIDIAVANFPVPLYGIAVKNFYREKVFLLIPKILADRLYGDGKEKIISEVLEGNYTVLSECPFVVGNPEDIVANIGFEVMSEAGIRPPIKAKSDNTETLLDLSVRGIGACFCPWNIVNANLSSQQTDGFHIIDLGEIAEYQIQFGYSEKSYQWNIISEFMNIAMSCVKQ